MQDAQQVAAEKLKRLEPLLARAFARGDHERYRQLRLLKIRLLHEAGWRSAPSKADLEAVGQGELFVDDMRGFQAQLVVLQDAGHISNVTFGEDEQTQQFVDEVRRLNVSWELGQRANVPEPVPLTATLSRKPEIRHRAHVSEGQPRSRRRASRSKARSPSRLGDDPDPELPGRRRRCALPECENWVERSAQARYCRDSHKVRHCELRRAAKTADPLRRRADAAYDLVSQDPHQWDAAMRLDLLAAVVWPIDPLLEAAA